MPIKHAAHNRSLALRSSVNGPPRRLTSFSGHCSLNLKLNVVFFESNDVLRGAAVLNGVGGNENQLGESGVVVSRSIAYESPHRCDPPIHSLP